MGLLGKREGKVGYLFLIGGALCFERFDLACEELLFLICWRSASEHITGTIDERRDTWGDDMMANDGGCFFSDRVCFELTKAMVFK